jgi:uncharacterized membrane protein
LVYFALVFTHQSCKHEALSASDQQQVCFKEQVLPIFQNSCAVSGCHDTKTAEEGYVFTDYENIMKSITAGNAQKSKAYKAITSTYEVMPPNNPLPENMRTIIRLWIEQGAKETCNN